ncbi:discoidin domain-containing protein [Candidatus Sumerlaeota bacterium]|nr:discoidin domain-containing protein [Candidatus Sumerlaeota bacterium]
MNLRTWMNRILCAIIALSLSSTAWAGEEAATESAPETDDQVVLEIEFPTELFTGTPKNLESDNLEPRTAKREPVKAPKGTQLISAGKPVTASSEPFVGDLEMVTDGDKAGTDGSFVEFDPGAQWVQVDLETPREIWAVAVWHYHGEPRAYKDVVIQLADDDAFTSNVRTVFNNDHDDSSGLGVGEDMEYVDNNTGRVIAVNGETARYVRSYTNGNTSNSLNHIIELEVYGKSKE